MVSWEVHRGTGLDNWDRSAVAVQGRGSVYSFGGSYRNSKGIEIRVLITGTYACRSIPDAKKDEVKPVDREAHTIVIYQDKVYLWGGHPADNTLWCFDIGSAKWSRPDVRGSVPEARWHHSACVIGRNMIIFGGCYNFTGRICNDLWILNLNNYNWKKKNSGSICCRCGHTATVFEEKMYVLGGYGDKNAIKGEEFFQVYEHDTNRWHTPSVTGDFPTSVYWHSAARYRDGIFIFGGYVDGDGESNRSNKLYHYNTSIHHWTKIEAMGNQPSPRRSHVGLILQEKLFVFGGSCAGGDARDLLVADLTEVEQNTPGLSDELDKLKLAKQSKTTNRYDKRKHGAHFGSSGSCEAAFKQEQRALESAEEGVQLCTEVFYRDHKLMSFPMRSRPKGYAIIININKVEGKDLPIREGSAADKEMMEKLFINLGYRVSSHADLKAPALYDTMTDFVRQAEQERAASLFVILMAHGSTVAGEQVIYLNDGSKSPIRREMEGFFNTQSAPGLALIPKVFIIQACQGHEADDGERLNVLFEDVKDSSSKLSGSEANGSYQTPPTRRKVASFCEYLFAYASQPKKAAIRIKNVGSWFIRAVKEVFSQQAATKHVIELFTDVRRRVSEMESKDGKVQLPETIDGLTKPFYIFPGIYE